MHANIYISCLARGACHIYIHGGERRASVEQRAPTSTSIDQGERRLRGGLFYLGRRASKEVENVQGHQEAVQATAVARRWRI